MFEWQNKVVLITGAGKGIGACVARMILEEGAKHIALLDVDGAAGETLQNNLNSKHGPGKTRFYQCDVTNANELALAFQTLAEEQGNIDVVINNAGTLDESQDTFRTVIAINFAAVVAGTLKSIELMRVDKGGKGGTIINIASTAALSQISFMPVYCGTKAAVLQFSNSIGKGNFYAKTGVRVLAICFGVTTTPLSSAEKLRFYDSESPETLISRLPNVMSSQKVESAAAGIVEAYKRGASGSTWLATRDLPVREITDNVVRAYQILGEYN